MQHRSALLALVAVAAVAACGGDDTSTAPTVVESVADGVTDPTPTTLAVEVETTSAPLGTTGGDGGAGAEQGASLSPGESDECPLLDDAIVLATMAAGTEVEIVLKNDGGQTVDAEFATRCDYLGGPLDTVRVSVLGADTGGGLDVARVVELLRGAERAPVTVDGARDAVLFATSDVDAGLPESDGSAAWNVASNQTGFDVPSTGLAATDGDRLVLVYHDVSGVDAATAAPAIAAGVFSS